MGFIVFIVSLYQFYDTVIRSRLRKDPFRLAKIFSDESSQSGCHCTLRANIPQLQYVPALATRLF